MTLGQGQQADLARAATGNLTFYDIFTVGGKNCTPIYLEGSGPECLAVKKGRNTFAMFFETRRCVAEAGGKKQALCYGSPVHTALVRGRASHATQGHSLN